MLYREWNWQCLAQAACIYKPGIHIEVFAIEEKAWVCSHRNLKSGWMPVFSGYVVLDMLVKFFICWFPHIFSRNNYM